MSTTLFLIIIYVFIIIIFKQLSKNKLKQLKKCSLKTLCFLITKCVFQFFYLKNRKLFLKTVSK